MYPLLVSGITSVASNLLDTWSRASERKAETERVKFQDVLDRVVGPAKAAVAGALTNAVNPIDARIAELRARLLDAPEVRAMLDAGEPSKPIALQLGTDGKLVAQAPGGQPKVLSLSPENEAVAQELSRLLATAPSDGIARAKQSLQ